MLIAYSRIPPSSCAEETRKTFDHCGQGFVGVRLSGGRGTISNWWTLAQPWRWTVPRQSAPVSPPPMMMTCLPSARDEPVVGDRRRRPPACSGAGGSPSRSGCPRGRGRGSAGRGPASRRRRGRRRRTRPAVARPEVDADVDARPEDTPSASICVEPAVEPPLLHLEVGDAVAEQAADPVGALEDGDVMPGPGELLRGGQPGRAGADDGDLLAGLAPSAAPGRPSPRPRRARRSPARSA